MSSSKTEIKKKDSVFSKNNTWQNKKSDSLFPGFEQGGNSTWGPVKTKSNNITVSQPTDTSEINADKIADAVVSDSVDIKQIDTLKGETVNTKSSAPAQTISSETADTINNLSGGQPLSSSEKSFFEPRFGEDFSNVRIHTDSQTADSAEAINAKAYNKGNDIVFAKGEYRPGTGEGDKLMAHELAHVVQGGKNINRREANFTQESNSKPKDLNVRYNILRQNYGSIIGLKSDKKYLGNMKILGYKFWQPSNMPHPRYHLVLAGSANDWLKILSKADDQSIYEKYILGFLKASLNPNWIEGDHFKVASYKSLYGEEVEINEHTGEPVSFYRNEVVRNPTQNEKIEFLKALYRYGKDNGTLNKKRKVDLRTGVFEFNIDYSDLANFILVYQSLIIDMFAKTRGVALSLSEVEPLATEGDNNIRNNMIASAFVALGVLIKAYAEEEKNNTEKSKNAKQIRFLALEYGKLIGFTLKSHSKRINDDQKKINDLLDVFFDNLDLLPIKLGTVAKLIKKYGVKLVKKYTEKLVEEVIKPDDYFLTIERSDLIDRFQVIFESYGATGEQFIGSVIDGLTLEN